MGDLITSLSHAVEQAVSGRSVFAVFIAFLFGVFVGFTPCVYPVLPLTVAYIGGISGGGKLRGFFFSLMYVLGMAIVYTVAGVIIVMTGGFFGSLLSNGWLLLILANFFILLGLWQLGVVQIRMPQFLSGVSQRKRGVIGALIVGGASGLIVGPCTAPGLAAMLALIGTSAKTGAAGGLIFGIAIMFAYSLGLGSLVLICGTFSGFLRNLPKSGRWLGTMEKAFAVLMILVAEFFLIYLGQNANFPSMSLLIPSSSGSKQIASQPAPQPQPPETQAPAQPTTHAAETQGPYLWELKDLNGNTVKLADYIGKKAVVQELFATWCSICMEEVPRLIELQDKYKDQPVAFVSIAVGQSKEIIENFAKRHHTNYTILLDPDGVVAQAYRVEGPPYFVAIDLKGEIVYADYGALPANMDDLIQRLTEGAPAK